MTGCPWPLGGLNVRFGWKAAIASAWLFCQPSPPMKVQAEHYERMRAWFAYMVRETIPAELMSDADPMAHLDRLASRCPAKAREGLSMAINDIIEMTDAWSEERVVATDLSLEREGLPSLTEMRGRFSKAVQRAIRRGHIKDDVEYYAVRNAVELTAEGQERLWALLAAYEEKASR